MLNNERFQASRMPSTGERIELLDPERQSSFVKSPLKFSSVESAPAIRLPDSGIGASRFGIRGRLAEYAASSTSRVSHCSPDTISSSRALSLRAKRVVDIIVALMVLLVAWPIFALVAILVCATSPGPALFRQTRLGKDGKPFKCLKFRTMVQDAESRLARHEELRNLYARDFKIKDDPRVTPIGQLLRKTSLDELPQFWNVLDGSMSLVGPRPIVPPEISMYGPYGDKLLSVKPGLTGVWQVCGRSDTTYDQRIVMDMFYVDMSSVSMDFKLLWSTVPAVIKRRGAY